MHVTAGLIFERVIHNLANIAACRTADDGFSDKCDVACLPVDGTCNRDAISERDGCVGENVSEKLTIGTECDAAAYLPEDTTGIGAVYHPNLTIGRRLERTTNLKNVSAFPTQCQNTSLCVDPSGRVELIHSRPKCLACQINTRHLSSERCTLQIVVCRCDVFLRLQSDASTQFSDALDYTRRVKASQGNARTHG